MFVLLAVCIKLECPGPAKDCREKAPNPAALHIRVFDTLTGFHLSIVPSLYIAWSVFRIHSE